MAIWVGPRRCTFQGRGTRSGWPTISPGGATTWKWEDSLAPIASLHGRVDCREEVSGKRIGVFTGDLG
jgi:hypothetical protein